MVRYCPSLNNAEIVVFLLRIREGVSYSPPACTTAPFTDMLCTHWAANWTAEAKKRGIAIGDAGNNFYPGVSVTRAQMAGYLVRGFDFPKAIDPATTRTVDLAYTNGLLTEITSYGTISYHPNLLVNQVAHGNGMTETWSNDPNAMRRPGSIAATGPAASWSSGAYVYDGTGNITKMGPAWFTYDKVNRLTAGNVYTDPLGGGAGTQQGYTFDPFGNLTAITGANARNTPTTAATNRLATGTYDAAGNLTNWNGAVYQYDRFNQMVRMTSGSQDWAYVYTADDERIWSYNLPANISNWTVRNLSGQVLREYVNDNGAWSLGTDYIHRDGQLLAAETRLGRRHFHLDHLGTPRLITNSVGYKKAYHVYYPFGEEATAFNQDSERMKFTGHERDLGSTAGAGDDLDYMHARHCSPVTGRFLSVDPRIGTAQRRQSWNRYAYARNNPVAYIDPDGRADTRTSQDVAILEDPDVLAAVGDIIDQTYLDQPLQNRQEAGAVVADEGRGDYSIDGPVVSQGSLASVSFSLKVSATGVVETASNKPLAATIHSHPGSGPVKINGKQVALVGGGASAADRSLATRTNRSVFILNADHNLLKVSVTNGKVITNKILTKQDYEKYINRAKMAQMARFFRIIRP